MCFCYAYLAAFSANHVYNGIAPIDRGQYKLACVIWWVCAKTYAFFYDIPIIGGGMFWYNCNVRS